jgi:hypothetical protein
VITPKFKVISSNSFDRFEERLNDFVEGMDRDEVIIDLSFQTCALQNSVEFSALIRYQKTEAWS